MSSPTELLKEVPVAMTSGRFKRYVQTVSSLLPSQIARLAYKRVVVKPLEQSLPALPEVDPSLREPWSPRAPFLDGPAVSGFQPEHQRIRLIGLEQPFSAPVDWAPATQPLLWQLELNYFHWLPISCPWSVARPWVASWLENVSRNPRSISWNPFGVAQRVLMWTRLMRGPWSAALLSDPLRSPLLRDLYSQCRHLARHQEKELLGNHLIKTAVGLYAGGRCFAGAEADRWLRRSESILREQLPEQILEDGGHYERSPMYHLLVLMDLLDTLNITPEESPFAGLLKSRIEAMARFATACTHGDEEIPLFNDSVLDQAPPRLEVLAYAKRVAGIEPGRKPARFVPLPRFGLFRLGDEQASLWIDAGETGPRFLQAHAHADTGSVELSVGAWRVICDRGVFSYQDLQQRKWDRSTPAHNTVAVGGASSSDCWGQFRVARRARIQDLSWSDDQGKQSVRLSHNGFSHLPGSPTHQRTATFQARCYTITDEVESRADGLRCDGFLYFGPDVIVQQLTMDDSNEEADLGASARFELTHRHNPRARVHLVVRCFGRENAAKVFLEPATLVPRFHEQIPSQRLRAACSTTGRSVRFEWILEIADVSE